LDLKITKYSQQKPTATFTNKAADIKYCDLKDFHKKSIGYIAFNIILYLQFNVLGSVHLYISAREYLLLRY